MIGPALLLAISISSISPSSGSVAGGTTVTIRGSGFGQCASPVFCGYVTFGYFQASFRLVDSETIKAITPAYFPGTVTVDVQVAGGSAYVTNGFTYTGEISDAFESVLLPIFTPPLPGSFGSHFVTFFSLANAGATDMPVFALPPPPCQLPVCLSEGIFPFVMKPRASTTFDGGNYDGDPGRLIYIPKGSFADLVASLRVADLSRSAQSQGTRIPIVPEHDFKSDFQAILDIPMTANFRNTLRIYSLDPQTIVHVRVIQRNSAIAIFDREIVLRDPVDIYHPGYAEMADDLGPFGGGRIEVTPTPGKRIWAFVSVTNNDTQQITVVAPH
jgi:hypothetical protein